MSLIDVDANGERNRILYVLKSRGMDHSKQLREYRLTGHGIELVDAYIGPDGVLTGSARLAQEARERDSLLAREQDLERRRRIVQQRRALVERQIADLRHQLDDEDSEIALIEGQAHTRESGYVADRTAMAASREMRSRGGFNV